MSKVIHSLMCSDHRPIDVTIEGEHIENIETNHQAYPDLRGGPWGAAAIGWLNDNHRVQAPMIRTGKRGANQWRRVEWDEALDYIGKQCKTIQSESGSQSIVWYGSKNCLNDMSKTLMAAIGSPNHFIKDSLTMTSIDTACHSLFGFTSDQLSADWERSKHIVLYGYNICESFDTLSINQLLNAVKNGTQLTVIDPRVTVTAAKATQYLMIRPGTDLALNYALIHVILNEKGIDQAFVDKWVDDLTDLKSAVQSCTPEWAESITGISNETIVALARSLMNAKPSVILHPLGGARYQNELAFRRSIYILNILLGAIESKGGFYINKGGFYINKGLMNVGLDKELNQFLNQELPAIDVKNRLDQQYSLVPQEVSVGSCLPSAMVDSVKGLFLWDADLLYDFPNLDQTKKTLESIPFIVMCNTSYTSMSAYADVIIPISHFLERSDPLILKKGLTPSIFQRNVCVSPKFKSKEGWWIIKQLADRLGVGQFFSFTSIDDIWRYQLDQTGVDINDIQEKGFVSLTKEEIWLDQKDLPIKTPSGKIELNPKNWKKQKISAFPECQVSEKDKKTFQLIVGNTVAHRNVITQNLNYCQTIMPENCLWINNDRAKVLGISNNDMVEVASKAGKGRIKAFVTHLIHPDAVFLLSGFGQEQKGTTTKMPGLSAVSIQELIIDSLGGGLSSNQTIVTVKPVITE